MAVTTKTAKDAEKPEGEKPANIAPATDFNPSGAPRQGTDVDTAHVSVDNDPRAGTTLDQNKIDFNEPSALVPQDEQVAEKLKEQAKT